MSDQEIRKEEEMEEEKEEKEISSIASIVWEMEKQRYSVTIAQQKQHIVILPPELIQSVWK